MCCRHPKSGSKSRDRTYDLVVNSHLHYRCAILELFGCRGRIRTDGVFRRRVMSPPSYQLLSTLQLFWWTRTVTIRVSLLAKQKCSHYHHEPIETIYYWYQVSDSNRYAMSGGF